MEVLHYVEFLLAKQTGSSTMLKAELMELAEQSSAQEKFSHGCLAGKIHMSEDLDKSLEDLAEWLLRDRSNAYYECIQRLSPRLYILVQRGFAFPAMQPRFDEP